MAFLTSSATYGVGRYGSARYGLVDVSHVPASVSASASIGIVSPNVREEFLSGVEATVTVSSVKVNLKAEPTGVQATFTVNAAGLDIRSVNTVPVLGVVGTIQVEVPSAGGFEIDVTERVTASLIATASISGVRVNVSEILTSVAATGSVSSDIKFSNTHNLTGVSSEFSVGVVSPNVREEFLSGVVAVASVNAPQVNTAAGVVGITAELINDEVTTTGNVFDFNAVKDLYSRRRTAVVARAA
jgi:hypothetical protein